MAKITLLACFGCLLLTSLNGHEARTQQKAQEAQSDKKSPKAFVTLGNEYKGVCEPEAIISLTRDVHLKGVKNLKIRLLVFKGGSELSNWGFGYGFTNLVMKSPRDAQFLVLLRPGKKKSHFVPLAGLVTKQEETPWAPSVISDPEPHELARDRFSSGPYTWTMKQGFLAPDKTHVILVQGLGNTTRTTWEDVDFKTPSIADVERASRKHSEVPFLVVTLRWTAPTE